MSALESKQKVSFPTLQLFSTPGVSHTANGISKFRGSLQEGAAEVPGNKAIFNADWLGGRAEARKKMSL